MLNTSTDTQDFEALVNAIKIYTRCDEVLIG